MPPKEQEDPSKMTKNYGAVPTSSMSDEDLEQPGNNDTTEQTSLLMPSPDQLKQTRRQTLKILLGGALFIALCIFLLTQVFKYNDDNDSMGAAYGRARSTTDGSSLFVSSPHQDMGLLLAKTRSKDSSPSEIWGEHRGSPLPTNDWYMNLVSHHAHYQPDFTTRAYTTPYIIDTAADAALSGIRMHWPVLKSSPHNVQLVDDYKNAITLGSKDVNAKYVVDPDLPLSNLGVSLVWPGKSESTNDEDDASSSFMKTSVVRGMPFGTMTFSKGILPSLYSFNAPASKPDIDNGAAKLECGTLEMAKDDDEPGAHVIVDGTAATVQRELKLHFVNSDFTWMVVFSRPVEVECGVADVFDINIADFQVNVKSVVWGDDRDEDDVLEVRMALIDRCTTGQSNIQEHCLERNAFKDGEEYAALLSNSTQYSPTSPKIDIEYPDDDMTATMVSFDWIPAVNKSKIDDKDDEQKDLLMFALPHHLEKLQKDPTVKITDHCVPTFHGKTCLVIGKKWNLPHDTSHSQSFRAPRPPSASMIPTLAKALNKDIQYRLSDNLHRGAADTYFSGKILARTARTILIATELKQLAQGLPAAKELGYEDEESDLEASVRAAETARLPSDETVEKSLDMLKGAVQVWLENSEAPYIYDQSWGGMVNCGCNYTRSDDKGVCSNSYPDCPALASVNEDFGNGFYNDHHFHYGYHVYAAAAVAKLDPKWGAAHFEEILLYIRDFANPSKEDPYFVNFRQKDWWLGSSWASGIVSAENSPHGRDQESSSEAIAAYEGVALFGQVMTEVFQSNGGAASEQQKEAALLVQNAGELLTLTETEAAERYWHVWNSGTHNSTYPQMYERLTVGMLYDTMASFETWFSRYPVVSYGIQLMPLTPAAERRDDPEWLKLLYPEYKKSCEEAGDFCIDNGWSIVQAGLCAAAGDPEEALKQALAIPAKVFETDGGMGNSLTNTIWYIATRN